MYLDCAVFENYRNIEHFPFSFDRGINILYGKNAQGKTNVIEGIYLFGSGKSFRHAKERDLIKSEENHGQISIAYVDSVRENKMSIRLFRDLSKEMFKNGVKIGRMSNFIGNFKAVLFCPEHLAIVKSEPGGKAKLPRPCDLSDKQTLSCRADGTQKNIRAEKCAPPEL